ncbi:PP2C family protein-serine/threonine phosphatase [Streptomyces sp. NPDC094448]|uniref:PP2C family protein-serine/threonine phosphatase n=1 Tax=Streptomyces sp. NPDC094448 TaxID=3366063 RepID=UPI003810A0A0
MAEQTQRNGYGSARRFARMLPSLMIVIGVVYDLTTPSKFTAVPMFTAAPLIAAPFFSFAVTLATGVFAVLTELGLDIYNRSLGQTQAYTELSTVVTVSALALFINRVITRSNEKLASARVIAEAAQRAVLPTPAEEIGGLRIAARYEAALADAFIGGDLFAVQDTPHGVRLVVGDVRGKGLGAVEAVAILIGAFREAAEREASLECVADRLEQALVREALRRGAGDLDDFEGFATAVFAEIPRGLGAVRLLNRGHPEPLLLHADGRLRMLPPDEAALPLGMRELGNWPGRAESHPMPDGSTLLLYTDGLSEARNAAGVFYDPEEQLGGRAFPGPGELLDALVDDVRRHTGGGSTDDMALLAVTRPNGDGGPGGPGGQGGQGLGGPGGFGGAREAGAAGAEGRSSEQSPLRPDG